MKISAVAPSFCLWLLCTAVQVMITDAAQTLFTLGPVGPGRPPLLLPPTWSHVTSAHLHCRCLLALEALPLIAASDHCTVSAIILTAVYTVSIRFICHQEVDLLTIV